VVFVVAACYLLQLAPPKLNRLNRSNATQRNDNDDRYLILELLEPGNSKHWIPTRPIFTWDELVGANWQWGELTVNPFKYPQYGRSVRLQRQLQLKIRPTIHEVFPGNVSSGKMTTRETSFREKKPSGKVTIRETTVYPQYYRDTGCAM